MPISFVTRGTSLAYNKAMEMRLIIYGDNIGTRGLPWRLLYPGKGYLLSLACNIARERRLVISRDNKFPFPGFIILFILNYRPGESRVVMSFLKISLRNGIVELPRAFARLWHAGPNRPNAWVLVASVLDRQSPRGSSA